MSIIHMKEETLHTFGELPAVGTTAPNFALSDTALATKTLADYQGKSLLINVYPSIDTSVCFESVKKFNEVMADNPDIAVICVSMDLPFALKRIQEGECFNGVTLLSDFRNREFGDHYGLTVADGLLAGLLARAVVVLDAKHHVVYHQLVDEITAPPDYDAALQALDLIKP